MLAQVPSRLTGTGVGVNGTGMAGMLLPADAAPRLWGMGATFLGYWTAVLGPLAGLCFPDDLSVATGRFKLHLWSLLPDNSGHRLLLKYHVSRVNSKGLSVLS